MTELDGAKDRCRQANRRLYNATVELKSILETVDAGELIDMDRYTEARVELDAAHAEFQQRLRELNRVRG